MKSIKEFFLGISSYSKVLPFVLSNKIWSFFVLPLVLNACLMGVIVYCVSLFPSISYRTILFHFTSLGIKNASWLALLLRWFFSYGIKLVLFYFVMQFYQLFSLLFLAPMFSYLSGKVHEALTNTHIPFSVAQFFRDMIRGIKIGVVNVCYQLFWIVVFYGTCFFLPFFLPFLPVGLFLLGAYYYGFSMVDYQNEVNRLSPTESRLFVKQHKGLVLGVGAVFQVLLFVPVLGTLLAPSFALVAAAVAGEKLREMK